MIERGDKGVILVVDDTHANLKLLENMLQGYGYQVRISPDGSRAVNMVKRKLPDLVLLDVNMPDLNGYEVCKCIKRDPNSKDLPIIFLSALGETIDKVKAFSVGGVDYLTKPFQVDELLARIETHLRLSRLQNELKEKNLQLEAEITERKRAQKEERMAKEQLIKQAHEAGKAELAIGVMHNIGNALTPAKIGVVTSQRRLQDSPLKLHLAQALRVFPAIISSADLSEKEKTRYIGIIDLLPKTIQDEYETTIQQLEHVNQRHLHIENIIHLQMRYAKVEVTREKIDFNEVVENAVLMMEDTIKQFDIKVITGFTSIPPFYAEETKILDVFINVIKNGCEAMAKTSHGQRDLTLNTEHIEGSKQYAVLTILDKGVGFPPEDKANIFNFGYSTKERRSGFGLHASGNYLVAQKASIEAFSDGIGQGAKFVIKLPMYKA